MLSNSTNYEEQSLTAFHEYLQEQYPAPDYSVKLERSGWNTLPELTIEGNSVRYKVMLSRGMLAGDLIDKGSVAKAFDDCELLEKLQAERSIFITDRLGRTAPYPQQP